MSDERLVRIAYEAWQGPVSDDNWTALWMDRWTHYEQIALIVAREILAALRPVIEREALERAAAACEDQLVAFGSDEYAAGQPMSSFAERFACGQCAARIRALIPEETSDG